MPHEPKLSVYTITLKPTESNPNNTNRWLFRNLINQANTTRLENSFIMGEVFRKFMTDLDKPEMYSDSNSMKCMTANQADIGDDNVNTNIRPNLEQFIIEGKVEGGTYGRRRNKTSIFDKTIKDQVSERDAITEDFYFLLYSPITSAKSVLMIQSYSDDTIDAVMKKFWSNFFSFPRVFNKPTIKKFFPNSIIEDFRRNATVSKLTFTTEIPGETLLDNTIVQEDRHFQVIIQIKPIGEDLSIEEYEQSISHIQRSVFTRNFNLGQFFKKKGTLKDRTTKKTSPFELGTFDIEPTIILSKYISILGNESDFDRIRDYCLQLLESIKEEIYHTNAIQAR